MLVSSSCEYAWRNSFCIEDTPTAAWGVDAARWMSLRREIGHRPGTSNSWVEERSVAFEATRLNSSFSSFSHKPGKIKPPTQKSGRARLKKPFYRETWADFHDMKSFQTGIMIFTWTQWHVFCSFIFYSLVAGSKPDLLRPCFEGGNDRNIFSGRRTKVERVCQANRKIRKHYLKRCEHATEKGYAKVSLDALGALWLVKSYRYILTSPKWFVSVLLQLKPLSFQVWRFLGFIWHSLEIPHTIASESVMSFHHDQAPIITEWLLPEVQIFIIAEKGNAMTSPLRWFTKGRFSPKNDVMTRPKMASSTVIPSKLRGREKFQLMLLIFRWTLESNYLWQALDVL